MINPIQADNVIKGILLSPNETRSVEFKPSLSWPPKVDNFKRSHKLQEIIKSILGMSNIRDGGKIILGVVKDKATGNYMAEGMRRKDLQTYDSDLIYQEIRIFGSPEPRFQVLNIEHDGKNFIVFDVQDFLFSPVMCLNNEPLPAASSGVSRKRDKFFSNHSSPQQADGVFWFKNKKLRKLDHIALYIRTHKLPRTESPRFSLKVYKKLQKTHSQFSTDLSAEDCNHCIHPRHKRWRGFLLVIISLKQRKLQISQK